jgi:hypothetical protein
MADASTCELSASHPPKPSAIKSFTLLLPEIKKQLVHLRHKHDKHEPEVILTCCLSQLTLTLPKYFSAVSSLSDDELAGFTADDLVAVRAGAVAYGIIIFGKVKIPAAKLDSGSGYIFVRWFAGGDDSDGDGKVQKDEVEYKFHSIYTEEKHDGDDIKFRAIMGESDDLFFFSE